jgi:hypothetical protein
MGYTNVKIILLIRQGFNKIGNGFVTVCTVFNEKSNSLFAVMAVQCNFGQ